MTEMTIRDGGRTYALASSSSFSEHPAVSQMDAVMMLVRWTRREPQRSQLRRAVREMPALRHSLVGDAELFAKLSTLLGQGGLCVVRTDASVGTTALHETAFPDEASPTDDGGPATADEFRPCDFETVVLLCKHMGGEDRTMVDARFWKDGGLSQDNLPVPAGGYGPTKVIEVTGNEVERSADDITVRLEGGPGYACSRNHPKITVKDKTGWSEVHKGETSVQFKALSRRLEIPTALAVGAPWAVVLFHYFPDVTNTYTVDVESCGRLDGGDYGFGRSQHQLRCYSDDRYSLKVAIPPLKKKTWERSRMTRPDGTLVSGRKTTDESLIKGERTVDSREEGVGPDGFTSVDDYSFQTRNGGLGEKTTTVTGQGRNRENKDDDVDALDGVGTAIAKGISFTRNGSDIKEAVKLGEIVTTIANIKKTVQSIADFIKDFQPQVGWKFTFEMELFAGELAVEWGYKEWVDHTVYSAWKFQAELTLFMLKLEVSFGASFRIWRWEITALIFGNVKVEAKLGASYESTPNSSKPFETTVSGGPKGELGIRAALGDSWIKAEGKLTVGIAFEAKVAMSGSEPFHIDWALHKDGVKAVVTASAKWVGSYERTWTVVAAQKNWAKGTFPAERRALSA